MKVTSSDLLAILRRFNIAGQTNVPREIDQLRSNHPRPINQLVSFRFTKTRYYVLFDDTAEDNEQYVVDQIKIVDSNIQGQLLENAVSELTTFGLPFKGKDVYLFRQESDKKRLDIILAERFPDTSRSIWQKHIKAGAVTVNSIPAKNARQEVSEADYIAISLPEASDFSARELPIVYIDDDIIVVNKPSGVLTHAKGALSDEFTVADFFRRYSSVGLETNRPGIVHRLDRDTSGIIVGARTLESFQRLKRQFSDRKANKHYLAIVDGVPKHPKATIDLPIGRNPSSSSTFRVDPNGKPARTDYEVIATKAGKSLVLLHPSTGRTHQLRVHMAHLGTPIHGDRIYGKSTTRLFLHAYQLEITPRASTRQTFTAPIPNEFIQLFPEIPHELSSRL